MFSKFKTYIWMFLLFVICICFVFFILLFEKNFQNTSPSKTVDQLIEEHDLLEVSLDGERAVVLDKFVYESVSYGIFLVGESRISNYLRRGCLGWDGDDQCIFLKFFVHEFNNSTTEISEQLGQFNVGSLRQYPESNPFHPMSRLTLWDEEGRFHIGCYVVAEKRVVTDDSFDCGSYYLEAAEKHPDWSVGKVEEEAIMLAEEAKLQHEKNLVARKQAADEVMAKKQKDFYEEILSAEWLECNVPFETSFKVGHPEGWTIGGNYTLCGDMREELNTNPRFYSKVFSNDKEIAKIEVRASNWTHMWYKEGIDAVTHKKLVSDMRVGFDERAQKFDFNTANFKLHDNQQVFGRDFTIFSVDRIAYYGSIPWILGRDVYAVYINEDGIEGLEFHIPEDLNNEKEVLKLVKAYLNHISY